MTLRDYLHIKEISIVKFAKIINYRDTYVCGIMHGTRSCGRKFKEIVYEVSDGLVGLNDWPEINKKNA